MCRTDSRAAYPRLSAGNITGRAVARPEFEYLPSLNFIEIRPAGRGFEAADEAGAGAISSQC